jgi:hypothetical protein
VPREQYLEAIAGQGLRIGQLRRNDYRFTSERALEACSIYEKESVSLVAAKPRWDDGSSRRYSPLTAHRQGP